MKDFATLSEDVRHERYLNFLQPKTGEGILNQVDSRILRGKKNLVF